MTYRSAQPGSARSGPAPQPADGRVRRVRAALIVLFPETPERGTPQPEPGHADAARSGGRRAVYVAAVVAVDAYLRRQAIAEGGDRIPLVRQPPWALTAVAALACVLALGWLSDYRYFTERTSPWGYWLPRAEKMLTACEHSTSGDITTWTWGHSTITIPCSRLRR